MKASKFFLLSLVTTILLWSLPAYGLSIDFDAPDYAVGNLANHDRWFITSPGNADNASSIDVVAGVGHDGSNGIVGTAGGSNFTFYAFNTNNADLGFDFDPTSSVLHYSFSWRPTQVLDGAVGDEIFRFTIGSSRNTGGSAAMNLTMRASGRLVALDGSTNRPVDGLFTLNEYATVSGTVDYSTSTYTVFVNGVQQFGGSLAFNNLASDNAFIRIGNLNGANATLYRTWNTGTIVIIPEPASFASLLGFGVLGLVFFRRGRKP